MATSTMWSTYRCWGVGWGTEFDGLEPLVLVSRNQIEIGSDFWNLLSNWKLLTTRIGDKFSTQFICGSRSWTRRKSLEKIWKTWVELQANQVNKGSKWNLSVFSLQCASVHFQGNRERGLHQGCIWRLYQLWINTIQVSLKVAGNSKFSNKCMLNC